MGRVSAWPMRSRRNIPMFPLARQEPNEGLKPAWILDFGFFDLKSTVKSTVIFQSVPIRALSACSSCVADCRCFLATPPAPCPINQRHGHVCITHRLPAFEHAPVPPLGQGTAPSHKPLGRVRATVRECASMARDASGSRRTYSAAALLRPAALRANNLGNMCA